MRLRGTPKNMNQGVYWVQRATSRKSNKRIVGEYTVQWNEDNLLTAFDDNGPLPRTYVTKWISENPHEAVPFANEQILIINKKYRLDYNIAVRCKRNCDEFLDKPTKPATIDVPQKITLKESFLFKIPYIGCLLKDKHIRNIDKVDADIRNATVANEIAVEIYESELLKWKEKNLILTLCHDDINRCLGLSASLLQLEFPEWFVKSLIFKNGILTMPLVTYDWADKKPSGVSKSLTKILFKNKTVKDIMSEQIRSTIVIAIAIYKFLNSFGYDSSFSFELLSEKSKMKYTINLQQSNDILDRISSEDFDFDLSFLDNYKSSIKI